jgi:hypothetical protein
MGSLIEELRRREAAALRRRMSSAEIAELNERLARAGERLSRLEITRETVAEILGGAGSGVGGCGGGGTCRPPGHRRAAGRGGDGAAVAAGLAQSVLLRAGNIAAAGGLSADKSKIEGLRSKLKRLAERGWPAGNGPGLFTLPRRQVQDASHPPPETSRRTGHSTPAVSTTASTRPAAKTDTTSSPDRTVTAEEQHPRPEHAMPSQIGGDARMPGRTLDHVT